MLGCRTLSYQPGLIGNQCCTAVRLGLVPFICSKKELIEELRKSLHSKQKRIIKKHIFAFPDAVENILALAVNKEKVVI